MDASSLSSHRFLLVVRAGRSPNGRSGSAPLRGRETESPAARLFEVGKADPVSAIEKETELHDRHAGGLRIPGRADACTELASGPLHPAHVSAEAEHDLMSRHAEP